ncbi:MAG: flagellar biosynthesis protein FlgF, partial [Pseudaminobacter sp.]|nr:flagellar biosynthesis protein FlgF [Pseudaminobacter sp.]
TGQMVTIEGYPVLDAGGAPIQLDPRNGAPQSGADGVLRQDGQIVGAIGLFSFEPGANFVRFGNSGIVPSGEPEPVVDRIDVGVAQGFLEESNVNPMLEMTRLIAVQRAFENTAAVMRSTEQTFGEAIKTLGSK